MFTVHPVNEEGNEGAKTMIVDSKTFPAKPPAIGEGAASGHEIAAGEPCGTCSLTQFGKIDAANSPMVKP
jgi:hypothetical protein